jgi:hypothetical protein
MKLRINPKLEIGVKQIADDLQCVVIDDFLLNPQELVDYACNNRQHFLMPERAYPGAVMPVDNSLLAELNRFIRFEMGRIFLFSRAGINCQSQYSLATLQPADFTWIQRLCHTDPGLVPGKANYAGLIYLFANPEMGGTGFFSWRNQAFWQEMTEKQLTDPNAGLDDLKERYKVFRDPPSYMTESNEAAELLDHVPARFNRFVFYSGDSPHGAFITRPELLNSDPSAGRLTLNTFVSALQKT